MRTVLATRIEPIAEGEAVFVARVLWVNRRDLLEGVELEEHFIENTCGCVHGEDFDCDVVISCRGSRSFSV